MGLSFFFFFFCLLFFLFLANYSSSRAVLKHHHLRYSHWGQLVYPSGCMCKRLSPDFGRNREKMRAFSRGDRVMYVQRHTFRRVIWRNSFSCNYWKEKKKSVITVRSNCAVDTLGGYESDQCFASGLFAFLCMNISAEGVRTRDVIIFDWRSPAFCFEALPSFHRLLIYSPKLMRNAEITGWKRCYSHKASSKISVCAKFLALDVLCLPEILKFVGANLQCTQFQGLNKLVP